MTIGTVWGTDTWDPDTWATDTWADAGTSRALAGQVLSVVQGAPVPALTYVLVGQILTGSQGAVTVGGAPVGVSLTGQAATFAQGSITPVTAYRWTPVNPVQVPGWVAVSTGGTSIWTPVDTT